MKQLPLDKYEAFLFDLDGTLADSMALHNEAWITTLARYGCPMTVEILFEYAGVANTKSVEIFNQRFGWHLNPETIAQEKEARFFQNIESIRPIPSALEIVLKYKDIKPMAIVSGGSPSLVDRILKVLKLDGTFPIRVCAGDTPLGKPHPDPFLLGAKLLNVKPEGCIVFEDGEAGIKGAKLAGMGVIKVHPDFTMNYLS